MSLDNSMQAKAMQWYSMVMVIITMLIRSISFIDHWFDFHIIALIYTPIFAQERRVDSCDCQLPLRLHGDRPNHRCQRALVAQRLQRRGHAWNL